MHWSSLGTCSRSALLACALVACGSPAKDVIALAVASCERNGGLANVTYDAAVEFGGAVVASPKEVAVNTEYTSDAGATVQCLPAEQVLDALDLVTSGLLDFTEECLANGGFPNVQLDLGAGADAGRIDSDADFVGECVEGAPAWDFVPILDLDCPTPVEWAIDKDDDGFPDAEAGRVLACSVRVAADAGAPQFIRVDESQTDCEDVDPHVAPDGEEMCNGVDDDFDGEIDEGTPPNAPVWYCDRDGDGWVDLGSSAFGSCDENEPARDECPDWILPRGGLFDVMDCDDTKEAIGRPDLIYGCSIW